MFATLTRPDLAPPAALPEWSALRPRPAGTLLCRLAPGVFMVRDRAWLTVSALDSNADLPPVEAPVLPPRRWPRPEWHSLASCGSVDRALFFGDSNGARPALRRSVLARARAVCQPCPVSRDCLTWALTQPEKYGIWGGTSGNDRKRLRTRLRAGATVEQLVTEVLGD